MNELFQPVDRSYFQIEKWKEIDSRIVAGFSSKQDGFSKYHYESNNFGFHVGDQREVVKQNRQALAEKLRFPLDRWIFAEQTHGRNVRYVDFEDRGKGAKMYDTSLPNTDGLYTDQQGILLALVFADCVPIYFFSPVDQKVGIVHAGWRGTVNKVAIQLVKKWVREGTAIETIQVAIGPSICNRCYFVDNKVIDQVDSLQLREKVYEEKTKGQFALDLKKVNELLLREFGIPKDKIRITNYCTSCHSHLFFSHRKDQGKTGRMVGFIGIREDKR
ncbi:peptidoglycan editing factor PgeF [Fervidibacillus albus]|uniref:Purine nucleoside phosphorylase n=1 Tax=Fervidibacillus albus TaxID=2980026 RepID=A0A9E8LVV0_9BACI|nr:peptidoglycan editing factor PgeF [Fervidibacillus albus]WAA10645.1 peptidoglycan editing factor PgeF [Fervidibacillus albus]